MNSSNQLLSDIVSYRTYSKYLPNFGRRESMEECINRVMTMHLDKFPKLSKDIITAFKKVHEFKIMPSMRSMQFAGDAVIKNNVRQYNCSFLNVDYVRAFPEILFLLLSGCGVGFSVQNSHIKQLPPIGKPRQEGKYLVQDSIQGWAQALAQLMEGYFYNAVRPVFDYSNISAKGTYLTTTGAKAPGPEPLKYMLAEVEKRLILSIGKALSSLEIHDIICIISDCVLSGGIRRAALISLFDRDDQAMLTCKHGDWWVKHPYRARANNSAVMPRDSVTKDEFLHIFKMCQDSRSGEPGFSWTDNLNQGFNPCVTGDTEILTNRGYARIDSLVGITTSIWNGFEWSNVIPKITGINQKILKIKFSDGRELKCTPYHKFHISTSYTGDFDILEASNLKCGMKLIKHTFPIIRDGEKVDPRYAYTQGFKSAEGMDNYKYLSIYEPKQMCVSRLLGKQTNYSYEYKKGHFVYEQEHLNKSFVPFEWNLSGKLNWLAGLFDGDGCELKEGGCQLSSIDFKFLDNLQKLLSTIGIQSKVLHAMPERSVMMPDGHGGEKRYLCKESKRICIGAVQMQDLKELGLECERMSFEKTPQRDASCFVKVESVESGEDAEYVYCFNEPKRHLGIFNGVITGQCHEISLNSNQLCNLSTINQTGINDKKDFLSRVYSATLIGTLQAAYTDFPYLNQKWQATTELEALLGVSFTGIADNGSVITPEWLEEGARLAIEVNEKYAKKVGINIAARIGAVKPEGTCSTILGSSSGVHDRHSKNWYLRRIRMNKNDALSVYLSNTIPDLMEDDYTSANTVVVTIPQESPKGAIGREDSTALSLFERAIKYNTHWIAISHRSGDNRHNVSCTLSVKEHEWDELSEAMWNSRNLYSGISLLPYDNSTHKQMPFEVCDQKTFEKYSKLVCNIDLKEVKEVEDTTNRMETIACSGGSCEL